MYPAFTGRVNAELARVAARRAELRGMRWPAPRTRSPCVDERGGEGRPPPYRAGRVRPPTRSPPPTASGDGRATPPSPFARAAHISTARPSRRAMSTGELPSSRRAADVVPWVGSTCCSPPRAPTCSRATSNAPRGRCATTLLRPAFAIDRTSLTLRASTASAGATSSAASASTWRRSATSPARSPTSAAPRGPPTAGGDALLLTRARAATQRRGAGLLCVAVRRPRRRPARAAARSLRPALDAPALGTGARSSSTPDAAMERLWPGVDHAFAADHGGAASRPPCRRALLGRGVRTARQRRRSPPRARRRGLGTRSDGVPRPSAPPGTTPPARDVAALYTAANPPRAGQDDICRAPGSPAPTATRPRRCASVRCRAFARAGEANADALLRAEARAVRPTPPAGAYVKGDADAPSASSTPPTGTASALGQPSALRVPARRGLSSGRLGLTAPASA